MCAGKRSYQSPLASAAATSFSTIVRRAASNAVRASGSSVPCSARARASAMASSIARRVPEPIEKWAVRSASPMSTTFPTDQRAFRTFGKAPPHGLVRDETVALQRPLEDPLAIGQRVRLVHRGKPGALPSRRIALQDERAHARRVAVVVRIEGPVLALDERLREGGEDLGRAEPGELVVERLYGRAEVARRADVRVGPVGGDDEVVAVETRSGSRSALEVGAHPHARQRAPA